MQLQSDGTVPRPAQSPTRSVSVAQVHHAVSQCPPAEGPGAESCRVDSISSGHRVYVYLRRVLPLSPARIGVPLNLAVPAAQRRASPSAASSPRRFLPPVPSSRISPPRPLSVSKPSHQHLVSLFSCWENSSVPGLLRGTWRKLAFP